MNDGKFQAGNAGRPRGAQNKSTKALKDALLRAADDAHPEGVRGWLVELSDKDPKAFASLLARLLPTEQRVESVGPTVVLRDYTGGKDPHSDEANPTPPPPKIGTGDDEREPTSRIN